CASSGGRNLEPAIRLEEMLDEEVELPGELVAVERNAERQELARLHLFAALLQPIDQFDGLFIERIVFDRLRAAEMRLQRHVAEVFENQNAEIVGVAGNRGDGQRDVRQQTADVHKRQLIELERLVVDGKHHRRVV